MFRLWDRKAESCLRVCHNPKISTLRPATPNQPFKKLYFTKIYLDFFIHIKFLLDVVHDKWHNQ